jgi:hypothetical protein
LNDENDRKKYFSQFFDDFYQAIKSQIDFHMKTYVNQQKNLLYNQIFEHAIQSNLLIQRYFPRQDLLEQVKNIEKSKDFSFFIVRLKLILHQQIILHVFYSENPVPENHQSWPK